MSDQSFNPHANIIGDGNSSTAAKAATIAGYDTGGVPRAITAKVTGSVNAAAVVVYDTSGNAITSFGGSPPSTSATGSAVPASASYDGLNVSGTLRGATAVNPSGSVYAQQVDLASVAGTTTATGTGVMGAGVQRVAIASDNDAVTVKQATGTNLHTVVDSGTITAVTAITNALPAGSNVIGHVIADAGSTTAVTGNVAVTEADGANTTLGAKTDAKSTATDGTSTSVVSILKEISAMEQAPASRAVTNSGTFAVQSTPVTQADTFMLGGVNVKEINAVTPLMGNGTTGTGSLRVTVASDNTAFAVNNTQQGTASQNIAQMNGVTVSMGTGIMGTGVQRVAIASDNDAVTVKQGTGTNLHAVLDANSGVDIGKLTANQSVNVAQINGVTTLMGNGTTGTGSQRVTIASDNTAFSVNANAGTNLNTSALALESGGNLATVSGAVIAQEATTSGVKGVTSFGAVTTNAPTYVTAKSDALSLDTSGLLRVSLKDTPANTNKLLVTPDSVALPANQSVNVAQVNGVTTLMGNGTTGTGSQRVTIASDNTAFAVNATLQSNTGVDIGKLTANQSVNMSQINAHTALEGGTNGSLAVGGTVATNVAITANPMNLGAQAVSSENTAVTTARQVQLVADLVGKLIVLPYANPENFVKGATAAITDTTSTSLIAAPASGLRNYITHLVVGNSHATVGTFVNIQDGSGGTTIYTVPAAAVYGGASITFPTPLRQPTTATAIYCACATTGANVIVSASGYKGA